MVSVHLAEEGVAVDEDQEGGVQVVDKPRQQFAPASASVDFLPESALADLMEPCRMLV